MSNKRPPKGAKFFIADDIRLETSQKPFLIGFFPNDKVSVELTEQEMPTPNTPVSLSCICILVYLFDFIGNHVIGVKLEDPNGLIIINDKMFGTIDSNDSVTGADVNFIIRLSPFIIKSIGTYKFFVGIGSKKFKYEFSITTKIIT